MDIAEQIKENFIRGYFGKAMKITGLPEQYPAWTVKQNYYVGVIVPMYRWIPFKEQFSQVTIESLHNIEIDGINLDVLMLSCSDIDSRNSFAAVCKNFVEPGSDGILRNTLVTDPASWWADWKALIGNVNSDTSVSDTLGELLALEYALKIGEKPVWSGAQSATHDIECEKCSIEVKTTTQRYGYEVQISSVYQMVPSLGKPLWLFYIRMESSSLGQSIEDVVSRVTALGFEKNTLERALTKKKLETGREARKKKFKVLEWKQYSIDESFPRVTEHSFKNNTLPPHVIRFNYTIDLSGLQSENIL